MRRLLLLILLIAAQACDRPARDAGAASAAAEVDSLAARPPAAYERRMLFLAGPEARPVVALFDFATLHGGAGLRRAARAWVGRTDGWDSVFAATWHAEPMRVPWLLVPHGAFRLLVGDGGEIEALVYRGDREVRLVPAPHFASWSRGRGAQLLLRGADLVRQGTSTPGVVLDIQLGRELPRTRPADRVVASGPADTTRSAHAALATPAAPSDTASSDTASATYDEVYVTDGEELHVVVTGAPGAGDLLWVVAGPEERIVEGVRLEGGATRGGRTRATWRIAAPDAALRGELRAVGSPLELESGDALTPAPVALFLVRGWIELRGVRRPVYGLLRRGQG
ncbi:MAG TPA: hypothetical protein VIL18_13130 [Longimicrobiales bacterium]